MHKHALKHVHTVHATHEIAEAIRALDHRLEGRDPSRAFDPSDPQTNALFRNLWKASFAKAYPLAKQAELVRLLETRKPKLVNDMRYISHLSEIELEKYHAEQALQVRESEPLRAAIDTAEKHCANATSEEKSAAQTQLTQARITAFNALTASFPYHTYETLTRNELALAEAAEGLTPEALAQGQHLIVEAGALPFTAIFSSLLRDNGRVLATIEDADSFALAQQLVARCEVLHIIEPGRVTLANCAPQDIAKVIVEKEPPCIATISQMILGKDNTEHTLRTLKKCDVDTVIARGAKGFVRLLYEPLDNMSLPMGVKALAVATPRAMEKGGEQPCYNTSYLYSSRALEKLPPESLTHHFESAERSLNRAG